MSHMCHEGGQIGGLAESSEGTSSVPEDLAVAEGPSTLAGSLAVSLPPPELWQRELSAAGDVYCPDSRCVMRCAVRCCAPASCN